MTLLAGRPGLLLALLGGFLLWQSALLALYALHAIGCEAGWTRIAAGPLALQRLVLLGAWAIHLAGLAALLGFILHLRRKGGADQPVFRFLERVGLGLAVWAILATIGLGLPLFGATACL